MKKLLSLQAELKAPKNQYNNFGKFKYRSAEDILEALKPLLNKHQCILILTDNVEDINDRYYLVATAVLYDIETGEKIATTTGYAREEDDKKGMDGSQITGASSSYARKYALNGMFLIDDTKDSDYERKPKDSALQDKIKELIKVIGKLKEEDKKFYRDMYQAKQKAGELTVDFIEDIIKELNYKESVKQLIKD